MDDRKAEAMAPLESVLRVEQLRQRCQRPADYETESRILVSLAQALADAPRDILQTLAEKILEGLHAGSAGLSLLTRNGERFYWDGTVRLERATTDWFIVAGEIL